MSAAPQDPNPRIYDFILELSPQFVKWDNSEIRKMQSRGFRDTLSIKSDIKLL